MYCRRFSTADYARLAAVAIALTAAAPHLSAGLTYGLNNVRYFPPPVGSSGVSDVKPGTLTAATVDSHETLFSTNPGDPSANIFDGIDTITGSPWGMTVHNSVTINTATTSAFVNWLSFAVAFVDETGVTITGGSGTGYLLPTFHFVGSFNIGNSSLGATLDACDGNGSCFPTNLAASSGGFQNVDVTYTPAIDSTTSFVFGTPFNLSYGFDAFMDYTGPQANPGASSVGDFAMSLVSVRVVNVDGRPIPGNINSQFFDLAAPEPGSLSLCFAALLAAAAAAVRKRSKLTTM